MSNIERFNQKILREVSNWEYFIKSLKLDSPFYPEILQRTWTDNNTYFSTIVRIYRNGLWYKVHIVERALTKQYFFGCLQIFQKVVWHTEHLYKITGRMEEVDPDQTNESDRLKKLML